MRLPSQIIGLAVLWNLGSSMTSLALENEQAAWSLNVLQGRIIDRWGLYMELQPRFEWQDPEAARLLVRPAAGYHWDDQNSLWFGYLQVRAPYNQRLIFEKRSWQQWFHRDDTEGGVVLLNRFRSEQRWLLRQGQFSNPAHRIRHMVRAMVPISVSSWGKAWWMASEEVFVSLTGVDDKIFPGFEQARTYFGSGIHLGRKLLLEMGCLNQFIRSLGSEHRMNHIVMFTLLYDWGLWRGGYGLD